MNRPRNALRGTDEDDFIDRCTAGPVSGYESEAPVIPMANVLVIEDDRALAEALSIAFEDAGHKVSAAHDGKDGLQRIERDRPDVVICDVQLPRLDGFSLCRLLRERGDSVPFLLLTARDGDIDQALGLDLGADDYVVKPASTRVLLARVHALLRRQAVRAQPPAETSSVVAGALHIDRHRLEARWRGAPIETTLTEIRLLEALAARPGIVLSRARLLELARGDDSTVDDRLVDTYIRRLRRKLEAVDPAFDAIETVIGAGYRLRAP
ncbi:response regulator transcription factor [Nannocystis punicea]|uniref:Response regulator transcription factor n=1 Tax=Nannocystis punicea TaxID=2995304 RepID=A0ABY7GX24_9BACT|nr:response regulator transcription factor [Nannocystis poenicansa]WAS91545.1 response regulator transcription factor [Nannocystis poenicansa]